MEAGALTRCNGELGWALRRCGRAAALDAGGDSDGCQAVVGQKKETEGILISDSFFSERD
jgi:hypothetical protein